MFHAWMLELQPNIKFILRAGDVDLYREFSLCGMHLTCPCGVSRLYMLVKKPQSRLHR